MKPRVRWGTEILQLLGAPVLSLPFYAARVAQQSWGP